MADADEGFPPLPALTEPPEADEELRLEDAFASEVAVSVGQAPPPPLGRAPAYDFAEHRLVPGAAGGPLMTRGTDTLRTWIEKCVRTKRGESPAVDANFGVDVTAEDVLSEGGPFDESLVAEYAAALERGISTHPRVASVDDVDIDGDQDLDYVIVSFRVTEVGEDGDVLTFDRIRLGG